MFANCSRRVRLHAPIRILARAFHIFRDVPALRQHRRELLLNGQSVGLVPTMGALHKGHISLVRQAAAENSKVFVSIYVNPTQFGVNEDLDSYPKTWEQDIKMLKELDSQLESEGQGRVEAIFAPTTKTMYPTLPPDSTLPGTGSFVTITPLANLLEGKSRPVFFRGVATVCMKLFNIVEAERVYFGQKDVQQTVVIKRMVKDLHVNTEVRIIPTEREKDGLAMSSRNVYLGERRRKVGIVLSQALRAAEGAYMAGRRKRDEILALAWDVTNTTDMEQDGLGAGQRARFEVDYISLADPETLEEVEVVHSSRGAVLSGAIKMLPLEVTNESEILGVGDDQVAVRLIDNIVLHPQAT
ncbi:probable pantoate--beta-alanine ligase [Ramularia collo-cygni]|uniref:Pantoate--beta-alanine ligase n=1 Tax=Ramularia collo-cygni TaxID=112498 RepID=A0A2D3VFA4_9PEZI|nr:probable pantoate--beta-alanine ligase [Ramularia collo-cygni]CZT20479.1 probable pantoate--beta-alanine ligase [Ramularia collo-cygni]